MADTDDKRKLLEPFAAENHRDLELDVADLKRLPLAAKYTLSTILKAHARMNWPDWGFEPDHFFLLISVPLAQLLRAEMPIIIELQQILHLSRDARRGSGDGKQLRWSF